MGAETFVKSVDVGKRSARRSRVLLAATLVTDSGEIACRLRDLSRKGALIECAQVPAPGSELVFKRGGTVVPARVAWAGDRRIGLEFLRMIDEQEVLIHIGRGTTVAGKDINERYRRPALSGSMSAEEREAARSWSVAVGLTLPEDKS